VVVGGNVLPINLNAVTGPMACGSIGDEAFSEGDYAYDSESDTLSPMASAKKQAKKKSSADLSTISLPPRSTSASWASPSARMPNIEQIPLLRSSSGTELMKWMHDAFLKVVVDATATGKDHPDGDHHIDENDQCRHDNNENDVEEHTWGVGNILANGFGWDGGDDDDDDDGRSRATYDTWDEENSTLRRLGSWGTVNS